MTVIKRSHYGKDVWVSMEAENLRKTGCLCINGCKRFQNNLRWQEENKDRLGDSYSLIELIKKLAWQFLALTDDQQKAHLDGLGSEEPCPIATANFAVCVAGDIASTVTRCKWFVPNEQTEIH